MSTDVLLMAAGMGTRLGPRTAEIPKALVEVRDRPLIDHVLDHAMALDWVDRVVVVTGCKADRVREHLGRRTAPKPVVEAHNPDYEMGNFYSLTTGLAQVGPQFLLMNVDHIYPRPLLEEVRKQAAGVGAVCDRDRPLTADCMKVWADRDGDQVWRVRRIDKRLEEHNWGYIGMTYVTSDGMAPYLKAVERVRARKNPKAWAEMVLQDLASHASDHPGAEPPRILDASGFGWFEVDDERDLSQAEAALRERPGFLA